MYFTLSVKGKSQDRQAENLRSFDICYFPWKVRQSWLYRQAEHTQNEV